MSRARGVVESSHPIASRTHPASSRQASGCIQLGEAAQCEDPIRHQVDEEDGGHAVRHGSLLQLSLGINPKPLFSWKLMKMPAWPSPRYSFGIRPSSAIACPSNSTILSPERPFGRPALM